MITPKDIRKLRRSLGITQKELGRRVSVCESAVCQWEFGKRHPVWKNMVKLNKLINQQLVAAQ